MLALPVVAAVLGWMLIGYTGIGIFITLFVAIKEREMFHPVEWLFGIVAWPFVLKIAHRLWKFERDFIRHHLRNGDIPRD